MAQTYDIDCDHLAAELARHLAQVRYHGARKRVRYKGVVSGALISMADLARLEAFERGLAQKEAAGRAARQPPQDTPVRGHLSLVR
ncbi:hypothetical protein [Litorivita sp. NS0012-18]|uniref:hypothetical protein n=1 Tax=Litorivita sp. NS0012-18 TaxID=3127655 RepID=UPI003106BF0D